MAGPKFVIFLNYLRRLKARMCPGYIPPPSGNISQSCLLSEEFSIGLLARPGWSQPPLSFIAQFSQVRLIVFLILAVAVDILLYINVKLHQTGLQHARNK